MAAARSARALVTGSELFRHLNGVICVYKPAGYAVRRVLEIVRYKLAADLNAVSHAQQPPVDGARQLLRAVSAAGDAQQLLRAGLAPRLSAAGGTAQTDRSHAVSGTSAGGDGAVCVPGAGDAAVPVAADGGADGGGSPASSRLSTWVSAPAAAELPARLVTGAAFLPQDIRLEALWGLGRRTSGPLLVGVNDGIKLGRVLRAAGRQLRVHRLCIRLGVATDNQWHTGRPTDRATFGHVTRGRLEALLSALEAAHQKHMFENSDLPVNSAAAYELAARGPLRPAADAPPVLYALRVLQFSPPFFTLEVHSINETEQYLLTLADDLGRQLRSAAHALQLRCVRVGPFTADDALLMKHWRLHQLGPNMAAVRRATQQWAVDGVLQPHTRPGRVRDAQPHSEEERR